MWKNVWADVDVRSTCEGRAPICRNYLRGTCRRSSLCKFRHVDLDQYAAEVHDCAVRRHHKATRECCCGKKRHHQRDNEDDEDDVGPSKTQDRLRILQMENASLRKRVSDLRRKVALLASQHKHRAESDFNSST